MTKKRRRRKEKLTIKKEGEMKAILTLPKINWRKKNTRRQIIATRRP